MKYSINSACPVCECTDAIRRVRVIYEQGSSVTTYWQPEIWGDSENIWTEYRQETITTRTALAQKMSPPKKPVGGGVFFNSERRGIAKQLLDLLIFSVSLGFISSIFSVIATPLVYNAVNDKGFGIYKTDIYKDMFLLLFIVVWIFTLVSNYLSSKSANSKMPDWQIKIQKWNKLYYCFRCDQIFFPNSIDEF